MAAPVIAVIAKKAAVILLTDKRTWVFIGSVLAGFLILCLLPAMVLMNMYDGVEDADISAALGELNGQNIMENLTPEQREQLQILENSVKLIEEEIESQNLDMEPLKPQIFFVCLLTERKDDENFYSDYISCFAETDDDNQIFDRISEKFDIEITEQERQKTMELFQHALDST